MCYTHPKQREPSSCDSGQAMPYYQTSQDTLLPFHLSKPNNTPSSCDHHVLELRCLFHYYLAGARPTLLVPRSYTEYHLRKNESPRMARGPAGAGMSMPKKDEMQDPWISKM